MGVRSNPLSALQPIFLHHENDYNGESMDISIHMYREKLSFIKKESCYNASSHPFFR